MVEWLSVLLIAGAWSFAAYMVWALVCNHRTVKFRLALLDALFSARVSSKDRYEWGLSAWEAVSYDAHLKELMLFRNPKKLYEPRLLALLED